MTAQRLSDMPMRFGPQLKELIDLWAAFSMDTPGGHAKNLVRKWRKLKHGLEGAAWEPGQARRWLDAIYELPEFRHWNLLTKKRWVATPQGRKQKRQWDLANYHKRKLDPEYRERKREYDAERYRKRVRYDGDVAVGIGVEVVL